MIRWFIENKVAANLLMVGILVAGFMHLKELRTEVYPSLIPQMISVSVSYPGAGPRAVESNILIPIEDALEGLDRIEERRSSARRGGGDVRLELEPGADIHAVLNEVQSRIDGIRSFPEEIERPVVRELINHDNVIDVAIYGATDEKTLVRIAQGARRDLIRESEVNLVELSGTRKEEISIEIPRERLRRLGLTLEDAAQAIANASVDIPAGAIRTEGGDIQLRTDSRASSAADYENITLLQQEDGTRIRLGELAEIRDGFVEGSFRYRFNGYPAVMLQVMLGPEQDVLTVTSSVREFVDGARATLPEGLSMSIWHDESVDFRERLGLLAENALSGLLLVFVILVLFLDLKLAFWVCVGIVVSFMGTFGAMTYAGVTINQVSLFGVLLVLGMVVDDAIVVGESIHMAQAEGLEGNEGSLAGVNRVSRPVIFAVATTIMAFSAQLFQSSTQAKMGASISIVVILALLFSLLDSLCILPNHLAHKLPKPKSKNSWLTWLESRQQTVSRLLLDFARNRYGRFLSMALEWRYLVIALFFSALVIVFGLLATGWIRTQFMLELVLNQVELKVELPTSVSRKLSEQIYERAEVALQKTQQEFIEKGIAPSTFRNYDAQLTDYAVSIRLELDSSKTRELPMADIAARWRQHLGHVAEAKDVSVSYSYDEESRANRISLVATANELESLLTGVKEIKRKMIATDGVIDVRDDFDFGQKELVLQLKPGAEQLGITLASLTQQVRQGFYGEIVERLPGDSSTVDVLLRFPSTERSSVNTVEHMWVVTTDGDEVPFGIVAELIPVEGISRIERFENQPAVQINIDLDLGVLSTDLASVKVENLVVNELNQTIPGLDIHWVGGQQSQQKFKSESVLTFSLVLIAIYVLLALGSQSYGEPLLILCTIPFGIMGAIVGHMIIGVELSALSMLGMMGVAGVVVNDNLVLLDCIKHHQQSIPDLKRALVEAAVSRFRAILLTSLTTFIGLIPILTETSFSVQFLIPMVISLAFGVLLASVVTLIMVPCLILGVRDLFSAAEADESEVQLSQVSPSR